MKSDRMMWMSMRSRTFPQYSLRGLMASATVQMLTLYITALGKDLPPLPLYFFQVQPLCCLEGVELPPPPICYILNPGWITDDLVWCPHQLLFSFDSSSLSLSDPSLSPSSSTRCLPAPTLITQTHWRERHSSWQRMKHVCLPASDRG